MVRDLQQYIEQLKQAGELIEISEPVNPELEITEITDRVSKMSGGGKALLFTNNGTSFPVLMNCMGSERRICMALGIQRLDEIGERIDKLFQDLKSEPKNFLDKIAYLPRLASLSSILPHRKRGKGACQEVILKNPDLLKLPVLKCWPGDGGRFITLPMVHTFHPTTGQRNVGMYRMQIFGKDITGMHWHRHKTGAQHFEAWKKKGQRMPVAVTLGGDPALIYAATAPLPEGIDEYLLAGFIRNQRVDMVSCLTQPIEVPSEVEIVIEGYIDPLEESRIEGPFGDHTGFYSLPDLYPVFHVTCITHRKNAVYPATIVGIPPQEDAWISLATEKIFLKPIQLTLVPEIKDMFLPDFGVAHNLTLVSIQKTYPGQAVKVANALWGAGQMMFNKILVVFSADVDIRNYDSVIRAISQHFYLHRDLYFSKGPLDVLDHSSRAFSFGGKVCIDATQKWPEEIASVPFNAGKRKHADETLPFSEKSIHVIRDFRPLGMNVMVIGVKKTELSVQEACSRMSKNMGFTEAAIWITVDFELQSDPFRYVLWYAMNNVDLSRDVSTISCQTDKISFQHILFDGTRKSKKTDNFERNWPNVIVSDEATIARIDSIWNQLGMGELLPSPSLFFRNLVINKGAEVME